MTERRHIDVVNEDYQSFSKIEKAIRSASYLYIYGAGIVGYGVCEAVSGGYGACVKAYVTTERKEGQTAFAGRSLLAVKELRADAEAMQYRTGPLASGHRKWCFWSSVDSKGDLPLAVPPGFSVEAGSR